MLTAKLFKNGGSQAVLLPQELRFEGDQVFIKKIGDAVILIPFHASWSSLFESLKVFTDDFMEDRNQPQIQNRNDSFE